jgi:hypothetical protein
MGRFDDEFVKEQRRRFMRPDAYRYIRHDAYRFMPPGSPLYVGEDVVKYFWPEAGREQKLAQTSEAADSMSEAELLEYRRELAKLRLDWELLKLAIKARKYSPNQPRVPAGNPDGGQWTSGEGGAVSSEADRNGQTPPQENEIAGDHKIVHDRSGEESWKSVASQHRSDGSLARQTILNRDGSFIVSEFSADAHADGRDERHEVHLPDGSVTTFQNSGETQTIFNGDGQRILSTTGADDSDSQATVQLVQARVSTTRPTLLGAAATLYGWLSSQNTGEQTAVFRFRAEAFRPGVSVKDTAVRIERLTKEQVEVECGDKYAEVQSLLNQSVNVINRGDYRSAAEYGTAVHMRMKELINGPDTTPRRPPRDPDFRAEVSFIKSEEEGYGKPGTIRVDALANIGNQTVCAMDVKTGKRGLSLAHAFEIATNVGTFFPGTTRIIVTEVRPSQ